MDGEKDSELEVLPHLPYLHDLSPSDYNLFPKFK